MYVSVAIRVILLCYRMPPKNAKRKPKGKQPVAKRTRRPPARLIEELPEVSDGETAPLPTIDLPLPTTTPEISNQFLFERLLATDEKINRVMQKLDDQSKKPDAGQLRPSTSDVAPSSSDRQGVTFNPVVSSAFNHHSDTLSNPSLGAGPSNAQLLLDGAVNHVLKESQVGEAQGEQLIASYLTAGTTLDPRIKAKIWDGQFIELAPLSIANDSTVDLEQAQKIKITHIFQWLRLFGTFMAVYLEKPANQSQAPSMVTYMMAILDLHRTYGGMVWANYDKAFRQSRAHILKAFNVQWQWHTIKTELLLQALNADKDSPLPSSTTASKKKQYQPFRDGQQPNVCFDFNKADGCTRKQCRFRHVCSHCEKKGHPVIRCFSKQGAEARDRDTAGDGNSRNTANANSAR